MNLTKKYLSIILVDYYHDDSNFFKAISSINNQIGFDLKNEVTINLVTNRKISSNLIDNSMFKNLEINVINIKNKNYYKALNNIISSHKYKWITFMDSRDLWFSDGSLLDFIHFSKSSKDENDILVFKNILPVNNDNGEIINFESNQFTNVIFGKYFNTYFLLKNNLLFNGNLNYYLFDDFASKSIKLSNNTIWYDLINYYVAPRKYLEEPAMEFIKYRIDFIKFINDHTNDSLFDDIAWSIVKAFSIIKQQRLLNDDYQKQLKVLYDFIVSYKNHSSLLANQFENQLGSKDQFYEFVKFLGV